MSDGSSAEVVPSKDLKEITLRALILGVLIGLVMGVANVYLGLSAGMTVSASIPAAVISMGILRGLFKDGTVLENNIVQTIASAGESLAAGIIFTMPALIITGVWTDFDFTITTLVAMAGGLLGVLFMIPLRKPMIVEDKELIYPEGVACARVLESGETGGSGMKLIFGALGFGILFKLATDAFSLMAGSVNGSFMVGKAYLTGGIKAQPMLMGVGFIVGINIATLVFIGGGITWLVAGPILSSINYQDVLAAEHIDVALKPHLRFLGVGAMIVGGLWSIFMIRNGIVQGVRETVGGYKASMRSEVRLPRTEQDMQPRWILLMLASTGVVVLGLYNHVTGSFGVSVLATVLMVISAFFFVAVAAYIVGLVGSSNSPVSGMTICSVLFTSAFIFMFGYRGDLAILATLGVAGVVCCATCTSGDVCQDLKTGSLVGATPYRQQWVEVLGVISAAFVMQPILRTLHAGNGIGSDAHLPLIKQGHALEAPQAQLFASLMDGFFGDTVLPWGLISAGVGVGVLIILIDQLVLRPRGSNFRMHVMPVAVGMYLPFELSVTILAGGAIAWFAGRAAKSSAARRAGHERGILLASGLIAGEALAGVLIAIPRALQDEKATEPLLPKLIKNPTTLGITAALGLVLVTYVIFRSARPRNE